MNAAETPTAGKLPALAVEPAPETPARSSTPGNKALPRIPLSRAARRDWVCRRLLPAAVFLVVLAGVIWLWPR